MTKLFATNTKSLLEIDLPGGMLYPLLLSLPMASALLMRPVVTPRTSVAMQYGGGQQQGYGTDRIYGDSGDRSRVLLPRSVGALGRYRRLAQWPVREI